MNENTNTKQDPIDTTTAAGAALNGQKAVAAARNAQLAADAIVSSHTKQAAEAACRSQFLKERAGQIAEQTAAAAAKGGRSGAREQVKGHFIEAMTARDYNLGGKLSGKSMELMPNPTQRAYDARHFAKVDGALKFAGADQIKSGAGGTRKAIEQMDKVKPGSAARGTLRTSQDQVAEATKIADGRIRVKGNGVTRTHAERRLDQGVRDVANDGLAAGSKLRAAGKAGMTGAAINSAIGAARDAKALKSGELSKRHFAENRAIDAGEGATSGVLGAGAAGLAGTATTMAITGTATGASVAAGAGAAGTATVGAIAGMGSAGTVVAGTLSAITAPVALPVIAGVVASAGVGIGVAKVARKVRGKMNESREQEQRGLASGTDARLAAQAAAERRRQLALAPPAPAAEYSAQGRGGVTLHLIDGGHISLERPAAA